MSRQSQNRSLPAVPEQVSTVKRQEKAGSHGNDPVRFLPFHVRGTFFHLCLCLWRSISGFMYKKMGASPFFYAEKSLYLHFFSYQLRVRGIIFLQESDPADTGKDRSMIRRFMKTLENWNAEKKHKPLMVIGPRRTGKTWIIQAFCESACRDYVYINLEEQKDMRSIFDGNLDPDTILTGMEQMLGRKISPDTPIFLDEIQSCENAITSLKYFCEDRRDFRVLTAGSLLGVKMHRMEGSFPVGKVDIEDFYPMDFEEFLLACGEELLRDGIRRCYETKTPMIQGAHEKALHLYHDYLFTGGMPEPVADYVSNGKDIFSMDQRLQKNLQLAYFADMSEFVTSPEETVRISETYHSIPRQLAGENPKFKYSRVRKGTGKRDFCGPLDWLKASGMILAVNSVEQPQSPLAGYRNDNTFKIYLSDAGMLTSLCGIRYPDVLPGSHSVYRAGITENYVYQQMKIHHPDLYYFQPDASMEMDMLYDDGSDIIPVEIQSGRHRRSTSLDNYRKKYQPSMAIRISENNFGFADGLFSVPLYAVFCIA